MTISNRYEDSFFEAYNALNNQQKSAVDQLDGPVLVLAGPGTGKTQILAVRIGAILRNTDTQPENILCLTYTDAGTVAMRKRLALFIGPDAYRVHIYTFHAFCNEVIQSNQDYFSTRELQHISDLDYVNLIEDLLTDLPNDHPHKKFKGNLSFETRRLQSLFKLMKEENWTVDTFDFAIDAYNANLPFKDEYIYKRNNAKLGISAGDVNKKSVQIEIEKMEKLRSAVHLFPIYAQKMKTAGFYDFSDMILWVTKAFTDTSAIAENMLRTYQERYLYFLVDEFQDTNGAQNTIISQLINYWPLPNIFAVGDDDQSIYEFQGARVKNILDFYEAYKTDIKIVVLTQNYRSNQPILDASKIIINNNKERLINKLNNLNKNLTAANIQLPPVEPQILVYQNLAQEEAGIMDKIQQLQLENKPLNEIAIIYHRHAQAENLIQLFEKIGIPYQVKRKINILDLPLVKNIITILDYLNEENKRPHSAEINLFKIMHFHFIGIHPHDIASMSAYISKRNKDLTWRQTIADYSILKNIKLKDPDAIAKFEKMITNLLKDLNNLTLQMIFEQILNAGGVLKYVLQQNDRIWQLEVITTLFNFLKEETNKQTGITIDHFLTTIQQMALHGIGISINKTISNPNGVQFISCHSAKGLEFDTVFLMGCTKNRWEGAKGNNSNFKLPDTLTLSDETNAVEALRRLFYVAMTRAKQHLWITYSLFARDDKELETSQFIAEILAESDLQPQLQTVSESVLLTSKIAELTTAKVVTIDLFDQNFIASKLQSFSMSASTLNSYLDCPIKFYFEKIVQIPQAKNDSMAFGTAIHFALQRLFDRMRESETKTFPTSMVFANDFIYKMNQNRDSFTEKQFLNRLELGKKLLPEYYENYIPTFNKVVLTEQRFNNIQFDGVPLNGVFDKIEFIGNEVTIVDYKTGNVKYAKEKLERPKNEADKGGDYWRQILFYKILMDHQKQYKWVMSSGQIDFIEKNDATKMFVQETVTILEEDLKIVKAQIKDSYQKIMNFEFTIGCGKPDCEWCNFVRENYRLTSKKQTNDQ